MDTKENFFIIKDILITGGAGFIGSHLVRRFVSNYPDFLIVNLDKLTYAGNLENLKDIEHSSNYVFEKVDIVDADAVKEVFKKTQVTPEYIFFHVREIIQKYPGLRWKLVQRLPGNTPVAF